jgi:ABC-type Fe3+-hydroxamate transport system substrate-binding protein
MRVVSLVPSVTETLLQWGIEPVACTRFCEQPRLRHVGGTKDPDIEAIVALRPEVVVVDREENRRDDAAALVSRGINVVDLHVTSVESAVTETSRLADIVGVEWNGGTVESCPVRVRAFVPIWRRPWMTINKATYGASILRSIGVEVSHSLASTTYPELDPDELRRTGADLVILPTEPYAFAERHIAEVVDLTGLTDVRIVDGRDLFWWGVRTEPARDRLASRLRDVLA